MINRIVEKISTGFSRGSLKLDRIDRMTIDATMSKVRAKIGYSRECLE